MKKMMLPLSLIFLVLFLGCREMGVKGSGNVVTEQRLIEDFNKLEVSGAYNIEVLVGLETSLEISAEDNLQQYILTEVINNKLRIENSRAIAPKRKIRINITVPDLEEISSSGVSNIYAAGIDEQEFLLDLSGAGFIELQGKVEQFTVELSGAGRLEAKELFARFVDISSSGASNADVYASESIRAEISGVGNINYYGEPVDIRTNVSGLGRIIKREF